MRKAAKHQIKDQMTIYPGEANKIRLRKIAKLYKRSATAQALIYIEDGIARDEKKNGIGTTHVLDADEDAEDSTFLSRRLPSFGRHTKARRSTGKVELAAAE